LPSKLKNIGNARDAVLPTRGKYGLVSLSGNEEEDDGSVLVGPEFLSEARLHDKGIDSDDDNDKVDVVDENESSKNSNRGDEDNKEVDNNRQVEPVENQEFPYNFVYGKYPLIPPSYENLLNFHQPYFLPPNSYIPGPLLNQYLQRRAFDAALRYPSLYSQYPTLYGQNQYSNPAQYTPFRVFYAQ
jgi:hypothetical protein